MAVDTRSPFTRILPRRGPLPGQAGGCAGVPRTPELGCSGTPPPACGAACTGPRTHLLGGPLAEGGTGHGSACATAAARPFGCGRHGSDRAPWLPPAAWVLGHRGLRRPQEAPGISHCPQCGVLAATSPGPGGPGCPTPPGVSPPTASRVSAGPRRGCGTSSKADACRHRVPRATGPKGPGCHQLLERSHPTSHTPSCCTGLQRPVTATPCVGRQGNPKPGIQKATHN